jgi:hypothetical protein
MKTTILILIALCLSCANPKIYHYYDRSYVIRVVYKNGDIDTLNAVYNHINEEMHNGTESFVYMRQQYLPRVGFGEPYLGVGNTVMCYGVRSFLVLSYEDKIIE